LRSGNLASFEPYQIENSPKNASYPAIQAAETQGSGGKTQDFGGLIAFFASRSIVSV
jgi:hypothetical protein